MKSLLFFFHTLRFREKSGCAIKELPDIPLHGLVQVTPENPGILFSPF